MKKIKYWIKANKIISIIIVIALITGITWLIMSQMNKKPIVSSGAGDDGSGLSQQQIEDNEKFKNKFKEASKKAGKTVAGHGRG